MVYQISDGAVIKKITFKQLLSSNVNKESLAMYFASHILECKKDSQKTCGVTLKSECRSNNLPVHHACFYMPLMLQREDQHPSISRAPEQMY